MTPTANLASTDVDVDHSAAPAADAGPFVLNLCSSTTPMALAQTELPELKRFTFFVSRRFEEGRERFRLHMGFFASQAEAEEWLSVVRDIYPGAWAGEAPGKKLRARAAEAAAVQAGHAVGPQKTAARPAAPAPIQPTLPTPRPQSAKPVQSAKPAAPAPKVPTLVPTLHPPTAPAGAARASAVPAAAARAAAAAQAAKAAQPAKSVPQPPPRRSATAAPASRPVSPAAPRAPVQGQAAPRSPLSAAPRLPQQARTGAGPAGAPRPAGRPGSVKPAVPAPAIAAGAPARPAAKPPAPKPIPQTSARAMQPTQPVRAAQPAQPAQPSAKTVFADSNVKEVMAALDRGATGETRVMPSAFAEADTADDSSLTDTQVLRFLETRREADDPVRVQAGLQVDAAAESGISLLKPDDTGTRRALKEAVSHNEPVAFAVQLQWSVQPVELDKVPPLAIFSAYTLYSVEGSREGRRWYGLRLGFFNDAISAKQVAYYVRSEFTAVAVVPVSPQERDRATEDNQRFAGAGAPRKRRDSEDNEFKLIDSDQAPEAASAVPAVAAAPASAAAQPAPVAAKAAAAAPPAAAARSDRKSPGKVGARERRTPQTLEETLEILGANELAIDNGSRETLSDTGVRHLRVEIQKNTPFSRLLERLSERVRKA